MYGVWLEVGLDGLSEASGVEQSSGDVVVEVAEAEGDAPEGLELPLMASVGAVRAVGCIASMFVGRVRQCFPQCG